MGLIAEFKNFIMRGNVVDLAVGVIIGAAFGGIVTSLVEDIIMPPIAAMTGDSDFSDKGIELKPERPNPNFVPKDPNIPEKIANKDWKAGEPEDKKLMANPDYKKPSGPDVKPTLPALEWRWGKFLQRLINFLIVATCLFFIIKAMNTAIKKKKEEAPKPAEVSNTDKLLMEIRDSLKK